MQASVVAARKLSSCGAWALLPQSMWNLPGPEIEPMSPALAGGFLTTGPPGKSWSSDVKLSLLIPWLHVRQMRGGG